MLVVGHDHGNMAVGSIVLSVVPIGKLIGTRKSEFAGTSTPPLAWPAAWPAHWHMQQQQGTKQDRRAIGERHTAG